MVKVVFAYKQNGQSCVTLKDFKQISLHDIILLHGFKRQVISIDIENKTFITLTSSGRLRKIYVLEVLQ